MHLLPQLAQLEAKYAEELVVIGVHAGKFTAEQDAAVIRSAILRYGVRHPVVNDRDYRVWRAYATRAWPTLFFIDPEGRVIGKHEGEAPFAALDRVLGAMLAEFDAAHLIDRTPLRFQAEQPAPGTLQFPSGVAVDPARGRLAVSDSGHDRVLLASLDGQVQQAWDGFRRPQGLRLDGDALYVADSGNHAVQAIDLSDGSVRTVAGEGRPLRSPWDVLPLDGSLLIAMAGAHQIWSVDLATGFAGRLAGAGPERIDDGPFAQATFSQPFALAADGDSVYVADSESGAIRRLDMRARRVETLVGEGLFEWGDADGVGPAVRLQHPGGLACHGGYVYIADTYNHKVKRLDPAGRRVETLVASGLHEPAGLAVADGILYVADSGHNEIKAVRLADGGVESIPVRF